MDARGDGPTDRALRLAREDQRPVHLTLHDLTAHPPTLARTQPWLVVENPSVIHEALMRGITTPIVCTSGTLTAIDHALLALAHTYGVPMEYSGDIDTGGRHIAAAILRRYEVPSREMDEETRRAVVGAWALCEGPFTVPALPAPESAATTTGAAGGAGTDESGSAIFQEHPVVLDRLLGPDPADPLPLPGPPPNARASGDRHL